LSGGQCQRVQIGRSLITRPELLVCDEPVSSLDVSVQAQIINLLEKMREEYGLTMLFISHDLAVVKAVCDRVAVMYLGKLCEIADSGTLYKNPRHPYSALLLSSVPRTDLNGASDTPVSSASREISSPVSPPSGCRFHPRCARCQPICAIDEPVLKNISDGSRAACHFPIG
jgi:peptide/nickel transport system ATP-binding protein